MAGDKNRSKSSDKKGSSKDKPAFEKKKKPEHDHVKDYAFGDRKKRDNKHDEKQKNTSGAVDFTSSRGGRGGRGSDRGGRGSDRGGRGGSSSFRGGSDRGGRGGS